MKRNVGLTRSPLLPGSSSLPRTGWTIRNRVLRPVSARRESAQAAPRTRRDTGPSRKVRALVLARDNWLCVGCGKPVGGEGTWWSMQHRKARGVGGGNSPCNLIVLCGSATSQGCHRLCEDRDREAHERGLWLRSGEDPAMVPVMIASEHGSGVTAWLTEAGGYIFEAPAGEVA